MPELGWLRLSHRVEWAAAMLAAAASLTPSLLPKTVLVQGIVTGMAGVAGYAVGTAILWLMTPVRRRVRARVRSRVTWMLVAVATLSLVLAAWLGHVWQRELAASIGDADPPATNAVIALLVVGAVVSLAVATARALRVTIGWAAGWLARWLPSWLAFGLAASIVVGLVAVFAEAVLRDRLIATVDESFRLVNREAVPTLPAPTDGFRSGGPGSLVEWSTLGRAGREFISMPAPPGGSRPVRVYAGVDSAAGLDDRADLVAAELERTGGYRRDVLCLVVPTGTGWVDPAAVTALEAQWAGDSAIASMQYSYLPSVMSLITDQLRVGAAARALVGAVLRKWSALPPSARPLLVLYGESLGSRGVEEAVHTVPGAMDAVSGVLLVGPPSASPIWSRLVADRDPGSPLLAPVVDGGRSVRFWPGPEAPGYDRTRDPWPEPPSGPRILYLQHPSDPIVWWSPSLLWSEPAWVDERTTITGAPPLRWRPIVTFWQISGDTVFATKVPDGHGHRYGSELAAAWAAVAPMPAKG